MIYERFFSLHVVNTWNRLPNSAADACTVNAFKACLDSVGSTKHLNLILQPM